MMKKITWKLWGRGIEPEGGGSTIGPAISAVCAASGATAFTSWAGFCSSVLTRFINIFSFALAGTSKVENVSVEAHYDARLYASSRVVDRRMLLWSVISFFLSLRNNFRSLERGRVFNSEKSGSVGIEFVVFHNCIQQSLIFNNWIEEESPSILLFLFQGFDSSGNVMHLLLLVLIFVSTSLAQAQTCPGTCANNGTLLCPQGICNCPDSSRWRGAFCDGKTHKNSPLSTLLSLFFFVN